MVFSPVGVGGAFDEQICDILVPRPAGLRARVLVTCSVTLPLVSAVAPMIRRICSGRPKRRRRKRIELNSSLLIAIEHTPRVRK